MDNVDISKLDNPQKLTLAKKLATNIRNSLPKKLYASSFTLKSKLPFKATSFREILIHRMSDLTDVALDLYETNRLIPAFVITRGVVETTAMIYWLYQKTSDFLDSNDKNAFDEFLMKGMLGSKNDITDLESYNILTAVDHLDKKFRGFRDMYDTLCEFVHPNYSGGMASYSKLDRNNYTLYLGKNHRNPPLTFGLNPLIGSLLVFQDYYNALSDKLKMVNDRYEKG